MPEKQPKQIKSNGLGGKMKRILPLSAALWALSMPAFAAADSVALPSPELSGGRPFMETLAARKSTREFSPKKIDSQDLSNILFAAWGISHDGKRTIPTAKNQQDLNLYVLKTDGIWHYEAEGNRLTLVSTTDIMPYIALQDFVKDAPLTLIFTGKNEKDAAMNAAAAYQNVGLYCASKGLNNVVRGYVEREKIEKALGLKNEKVIITQTIGWPYM